MNMAETLRFREPMARHVSWRAGGPADRFFAPSGIGELVPFLKSLPSAEPILFVGLGAPKQERWMAAHTGQVRAVLLGVGAAFDFLAGRKRQAPRLVQQLGLEWLYRMSLEPRRLFLRYLITNPHALYLLLADGPRSLDGANGLTLRGGRLPAWLAREVFMEGGNSALLGAARHS